MFDDFDLDSLLIDGVDDNSSASLESASFDTDSYELTPSEESAIFLDAMYNECSSPEEFMDFVTENASMWEMYGLIEDATAALEAVKRMRIDNWKQVNLGRVSKREAIRLAEKANSADYRKYKKYRALYRKYRDKIFVRYGTRGKTMARRAIANSRNKASSTHAQSTTKKIDNTIKKLNRDGRNGQAIKETGK
jgi:hypothetical protein